MKPILLLLTGVLAVSTGAIFIKLCDLNHFTVGAYRLTLALPLFWLWAHLAEPGWLARIKGSQWKLLILSGTLLGLHFATWIASLSYTSVTSSVVLVTTNPIFVGLGSAFLLKEKVPAPLWLGTLLAFGGTVFVAVGSPAVGHSAPNPLLGNALALVGALCMSGYLLVGRKLSREMPTICYVTCVYTVAAATLWLGVLLHGSPTWGFSRTQWLLLILMALVPQAIGHTLINRSLKLLSPSLVALAILGEPVFASLLAIPVLQEYPSKLQLMGGVTVMIGVAYATFAKPPHLAQGERSSEQTSRPKTGQTESRRAP